MIVFQISGETLTERFDGVIVASGHHSIPHTPKIEGQDVFKGTQLHSNVYRTWKGFEDKRVVVVGLGVSAAEVACELGTVCSQVGIYTFASKFDLSFTTSDIGLLLCMIEALQKNPLSFLPLQFCFNFEFKLELILIL